MCGTSRTTQRSTSSSTSSSTPNNAPQATELWNASGQLPGTYTPYSGILTAPTTTQQQSGYTGVDQYANAAQPGLAAALQTAQGVAAYRPDQVTGQGYKSVGYDATGAAGLPGGGVSAGPGVGATDVRATNISSRAFPSVDIAGYMNPYTQQVVDTTMSELGRQNAKQIAANQAAAAAAGAYGGSRHGWVDAGTNEAFQRTGAATAGDLYRQGYTQAQNTAETDLAREQAAAQANQDANLRAGLANQGANLQAGLANQAAGLQAQTTNAGLLSNLNMFNAAARNSASEYGASAENAARQFNANAGNTASLANQAAGLQGAGLNLNAANVGANVATQAQNAGLQGAQAQIASGTQQQQTAQAAADAAYQQWQLQQQFPYQFLQYRQGLLPNLGQTGTQAGQSTQTTETPNNYFGQLLDAGASIASARLGRPSIPGQGGGMPSPPTWGPVPNVPTIDIPGMASGGTVYGPGGPKDDLVPALLSNGEGVLTAETVRALGGPAVIDRLNHPVRMAGGGVAGASRPFQYGPVPPPPLQYPSQGLLNFASNHSPAVRSLLNTTGVAGQGGVGWPGLQGQMPPMSEQAAMAPPAAPPPPSTPDQAAQAIVPDMAGPSKAFRNALLAGGQAAGQTPGTGSAGSTILSTLARGLASGAKEFVATKDEEADKKMFEDQVDAMPFDPTMKRQIKMMGPKAGMEFLAKYQLATIPEGASEAALKRQAIAQKAPAAKAWLKANGYNPDTMTDEQAVNTAEFEQRRVNGPEREQATANTTDIREALATVGKGPGTDIEKLAKDDPARYKAFLTALAKIQNDTRGGAAPALQLGVDEEGYQYYVGRDGKQHYVIGVDGKKVKPKPGGSMLDAFLASVLANGGVMPGGTPATSDDLKGGGGKVKADPEDLRKARFYADPANKKASGLTDAEWAERNAYSTNYLKTHN